MSLPFVNRQAELSLIKNAFESLHGYSKTSPLLTPVIDFFGIEGIGKTTLLYYIEEQCHKQKFQYVFIRESQDAQQISFEIMKEIKERYQLGFSPVAAEGDLFQSSLDALRMLLSKGKVVLIVDNVDDAKKDVLERIAATLHGFIDEKKLLTVLASKKSLLFDFERSISRQLTSLQLKSLDRQHGESCLYQVEPALARETRSHILDWTSGYPLAMSVMTQTILDEKLDPAQAEDQKKLIKAMIKNVIDARILNKVTKTEQDNYRQVLSVLSFPRYFNLLILQELIEQFAPEQKRPSSLAYMKLPTSLRNDTGVLTWNPFRGGFTIDALIRNLFLLQGRIEQPERFQALHRFLARRNRELSELVKDSDQIRYLCEYLYHAAYEENGQTFTESLDGILIHFGELSLSFEAFETSESCFEELLQDREFLEAVGAYSERVRALIYRRLAAIHLRKATSTTGEEQAYHRRGVLLSLMKEPTIPDLQAEWLSALNSLLSDENREARKLVSKELLADERLQEAVGKRSELLARVLHEISKEG